MTTLDGIASRYWRVLLHRVEGVTDARHPGEQRDLVPGEAVGVPLAIDTLVVMAHDGCDVVQDGRRCDQCGTDHRMPFDVIELFGCEATWLGEDCVVDVQLADVVQQCAEADCTELYGRQTEFLADGDRGFRCSLDVFPGGRVLAAEVGDECVHDRIEAVLQRIEGVAKRERFEYVTFDLPDGDRRQRRRSRR